MRGRPNIPSNKLRGAKLARLTQKIPPATLVRIFGISRQAISKDIMKYREAVVREG